jgi:hypothetical protein
MRFLKAVGRDAILAAAPSDWDLPTRMLREATPEALLAELRRRQPPPEAAPKLSRIGHAGKHAGPTLDITPTGETTTKH